MSDKPKKPTELQLLREFLGHMTFDEILKIRNRAKCSAASPECIELIENQYLKREETK